MLCQDCPDRETCTKLCEAAEAYVSQDHVEWTEVPMSIYFDEDRQELRVFDDLTWQERSFLTPTEKAVCCALGQGHTRAEACKILGISAASMRNHIARLRKKAQQISPYTEGENVR